MLRAVSLAAIQPITGPKNVDCILKCNEKLGNQLRGYGKVKLCNFVLRFPLFLSAFKSSPNVTVCLLTQTVLKKNTFYIIQRPREGRQLFHSKMSS
jgi:hypothetical protein